MQQLLNWLKTVWAFLRHLGKAFIDNGCQKSAAALTYMTLFAIVPLMTVMYSVFSLIPAFREIGDRLERLIFTYALPETGHEIQSYLAGFSEQARSLSGVGVVMLVVTSYLMLTNIEKTFNAIWGVQRPRRGISSFLLYWAVLSIGPLLLGAGLVITTYLLSLRLVLNEYDMLGIGHLIFSAVPFLLAAAAFTLLFVAVPNCRVPFRYGVLGGMVTALLYEALKSVFHLLVANSSFQLVYGAFAAVPLFLIWVNLMWTIILGGAVLVRTFSEHKHTISERKKTNMSAALDCLELFRRRSQDGRSVSDRDCYQLGLSVVQWQYLRSRLVRNKWITATFGGHYVLCRDLHSVTLWDLALVVDMTMADLDVAMLQEPEDGWFALYSARRKRINNEAKSAFGVSVAEALTKPDGGQVAAAE